METYKAFKLRVIKGVYGVNLKREEWNHDGYYTDFVSHYNILKEAFESIEDEPHIWVKNALNEYFTKWTDEMDGMIEKDARG